MTGSKWGSIPWGKIRAVRKRTPRADEEHQAQVDVCRWLDARGIVYFAVPNGGKRHPGVARKLKAEGVKPGVPDLVILSRGKNGKSTVLEMKKANGGKVSVAQKWWLYTFQTFEWNVVIGLGYADAINKLRDLGYDES